MMDGVAAWAALTTAFALTGGSSGAVRSTMVEMAGFTVSTAGAVWQDVRAGGRGNARRADTRLYPAPCNCALAPDSFSLFPGGTLETPSSVLRLLLSVVPA
jgi:hypothetical protein